MEKHYLIGLNPTEYEHPFDKAALAALTKLKGFDTVVNFFLNWTHVRWDLIEKQGSCFHVTLDSCSELYKQVKNLAAILEVKDVPEVYTTWGYFINGYTTGIKDKTMIVLQSGAIDLLNEDELGYVIGHELGHVKSGHVLYHVMGSMIAQATTWLPLGEALLAPIQVALMYWNRMSEFTADRAGLLACQNKEAAINAIIKMCGVPGKYFGELSEEAILKQAEEFETRFNSSADKAMRSYLIMSSSHPWTVYRAGELIKWIRSGEYDRIVEKYTASKCPHCGEPIGKGVKICNCCGLPI